MSKLISIDAFQVLEKYLNTTKKTSLFIQEITGEVVFADEKQIRFELLPETRGAVLRRFVNGQWIEVAFQVATAQDARFMIEQIEALSRDSSGQETELPPEHPLEFERIVDPEDDWTDSKKAELAREVVRKIKGGSRHVLSAMIKFRASLIREEYFSSVKKMHQSYPRFEAIYQADFSGSVGGLGSLHNGFAGAHGWVDAISDSDIDSFVRLGEKISDAKRIEPGMYDLIFTPSLSGILAHEAFGHGTEGDTIQKGRARAGAYFGKSVGSPLVTIIDSPARSGESASYFFDHEGQMATETKIVENGILQKPITDYRTAALLHTERTANGRRQAFDHKVYTRMTNTWFAPGESSPEELIASVEYGYLIDHARNGMEDPNGWGIQLEAMVAEKIVRGKRTGEIFSPVIITGFVPDILASVSMISSRVKINGLGMCGKGHKEWVKVTDGGPWMKLRARLA